MFELQCINWFISLDNIGSVNAELAEMNYQNIDRFQCWIEFKSSIPFLIERWVISFALVIVVLVVVSPANFSHWFPILRFYVCIHMYGTSLYLKSISPKRKLEPITHHSHVDCRAVENISKQRTVFERSGQFHYLIG